jgi:hypothetical protein
MFHPHRQTWALGLVQRIDCASRANGQSSGTLAASATFDDTNLHSTMPSLPLIA